jgi:hypothetical protein
MTTEEEAEGALLQPQQGEMHDLAPGTLRFVSVLFVAAMVLMLAGII